LNIDIFNHFDLVVMGISLLLLLFAHPVVGAFRSHKDDKQLATRVWTLRVINIILLLLYLSEVIFTEWTKQLSQTGLTLLLTLLGVSFLQMIILRRYGRVREIQGSEYRTETYQSELFGLIAVVVALFTSILIIINIWGLTSWLEATSVMGAFLIFLFSTKDVWAPDNINGLILLYNGDIETGSIVRIEEYNLLAYAIQTTLTQTVFRDLKSKHYITLPNAKLRNAKVEILSKCPSSGLMEQIDFKIGYDVEPEKVDLFAAEVWKRACEMESAINAEKQGVARLLENGDHAVTWRFCYWLKNIYGLYDARFAVNRAANEVAREQGISLATPTTHEVELKRH
jgi:small-conductance mechanosensitive channel